MKSIEDIWGFELYNKIWSSTDFNNQYIKLILNALKNKKNILDIGVGIGNISKKLLEENKKVYAIDINSKAISYVRKKIGIKIHFPIKKQDARKLNFRKEFDGVCAANIFLYLTNKELDLVIQKIHKALKKGGVLAIVGYENNKRKKWAQLTGESVKRAIEKGKLILTQKELRKLPIAQKFNLKTNDSAKRTITSLKKNKFDIIKKNKYYYNTCYFILAQKN